MEIFKAQVSVHAVFFIYFKQNQNDFVVFVAIVYVIQAGLGQTVSIFSKIRFDVLKKKFASGQWSLAMK